MDDDSFTNLLYLLEQVLKIILSVKRHFLLNYQQYDACHSSLALTLVTSPPPPPRVREVCMNMHYLIPVGQRGLSYVCPLGNDLYIGGIIVIVINSPVGFMYDIHVLYFIVRAGCSAQKMICRRPRMVGWRPRAV